MRYVTLRGHENHIEQAGCSGVCVPGRSIIHVNMISYWTVY